VQFRVFRTPRALCSKLSLGQLGPTTTPLRLSNVMLMGTTSFKKPRVYPQQGWEVFLRFSGRSSEHACGKAAWRKTHPDFTEPQLSRNLELVERLREVGRAHNRSTGEAAIAWTLHHPAVTGAIVGARNARQAEGVMRAGELHLSDEEATEIETLLIGAAA
jgi:hypothetical protein